MADDLKNRGPADASRVSTSEEWEVRYWTKALGCTHDELRAAVKMVGSSAEAVRHYLQNKK